MNSPCEFTRFVNEYMKPKTFFILFYLAFAGVIGAVVCLATATTFTGGLVSAAAMWAFGFLIKLLLEKV